MPHTIVEYYSDHSGYRCGYCKSPDSNYSHGMWAHSLTVSDYEGLLNRGWRRSGSYLYKPTNARTCCPMYTISCHALDFKPSKSQKKVLKKFSSQIGNSSENMTLEDHFKTTPGFTVKQVRTDSPEFQTTLLESHLLYKKYQMKVHQDSEEECNLKQFKRFLCGQPFKSTGTTPPTSGTHHHHYYLSNKLIAVGVVDILPSCLSSVYFFYDPDYSHLSLGTLSALYEISCVRQMNAINSSFKFYYMGFYIHSCQKMRYKGNYHPSHLLCPETYQWVLLDDKLRGILDKEKYKAFGRADDDDDKKGGHENMEEQNEDVEQITILYKKQVLPYALYKSLRRSNDDPLLQEYVNLVGAPTAHSILLYRE